MIVGGFHHFDFGGGVEACLLPTNRFKTAVFKVYIHRPLDDHTTAAALLQQVKRRGCRRWVNLRKILIFLEDLYGAGLSSAIVKIGERQVLYHRLEVLSDKFTSGRGTLGRAVEFLRNLVRFPHTVGGTLPADVTETERVNLRNLIAGMINDRGEYAYERCVEEMCAGEPYGRYEYGRIDELAALTPKALTELHERTAETAPISIYAFGDFEPDKMAARLEKAFARRRRPVEVPAPADPAPRNGPREVIERIDVEQAKLVMGFRTGQRMSSPGYPALMVMNAVYGAFPHSRLFVNVRERDGLAYYASSGLEATKGVMFVQSGIDPANYRRAADVIEAELESLRRGEATEAEVAQAKETLCDRVRKWDDEPSARMGALAEMRINGVAWTPEEMTAAITAVTPDAIAQAARRLRLDTVYLLTRP